MTVATLVTACGVRSSRPSVQRAGQEELQVPAARVFDPSLSPDWLLTAALALGRAAEDEVKAGRMSIEAATQAVHHSFLRLFMPPAGQQPGGKPLEPPRPAH